MFEPRRIPPRERLNTRQWIVVVIMDILLLSELTWAVYRGQHNRVDMTAIFLRTFIPLAAATFIVTRYLLRRLQSPETGDASVGPDEAPGSRPVSDHEADGSVPPVCSGDASPSPRERGRGAMLQSTVDSRESDHRLM